MTGTAEGGEVAVAVRRGVGCITLQRPPALNALTLGMVRTIATALQAWRDDPSVRVVALRGTGRDGQPFGAFCAGGDIRFLHRAALHADPRLDDFFTEEYALDHAIHRYPKPVVAFLDGVVMGGGMGLGQGASLRIVTERTRMAMPETQIGLFPDVGGGYFLSRCPGRVGEYLALTGAAIGADEALGYGLADRQLPASSLPALWDALPELDWDRPDPLADWCAMHSIAKCPGGTWAGGRFDAYFSLPDVQSIVQALEGAGSAAGEGDLLSQVGTATTSRTSDGASGNAPRRGDTDASTPRDKNADAEAAHAVAATLRQRSPLMLNVALQQIRRARGLGLADDLRMERGMVHRCFTLRPGAASETVEGIRALAVDKDQAPRWNPLRIEDVTPEQVAPFFEDPWTPETHPLRALG